MTHTHSDNHEVTFESKPLLYWRSIENRERTKAYVESIRDEFKQGDSEISGLQRREMLKLMGASLAFAGVGVACRRPEDKIVPYVKAPEEIVPGLPNYFATARPSVWGATGLLVESHEGRPTKIEGNPEHPSSLGSANLHDQASVLELYDPDRSRLPSQKVIGGRDLSSLSEWDAFAQTHFNALANVGGEGLAFLTNGEDSPTMIRLKGEILKKYPKAKFFAYNPLNLGHTETGASLAFGKNARVELCLENAKVILTLQADTLMLGAQALKNARGFGQGRKIYSAEEAAKMNRLYAVESAFSVTGTNADHRLRLSASDTADFLKVLTAELLANPALSWSAQAKAQLPALIKTRKTFEARFVKALAKDLAKNMGQALICVGENQPAEVHALAHVVNQALLGQGKTFKVYKTSDDKMATEGAGATSLAALVQALNAGQVQTLLMLDVNPVYSAPGALAFEKALSKAKTTVHAGLYADETAQVSDWHIPLTHFLESWSDARAYDGTASIVQPLIAPLHKARSTVELLAQALNTTYQKGYDVVQATWRGVGMPLASDKVWRKAVHDGVIGGTRFAEVSSQAINWPLLSAGLAGKTAASPSKTQVELLFSMDYSVLDGRYANLGWLQELPDPITKLTWDNALLVSQTMAKQMGLKSRVSDRVYKADTVLLQNGDVSIEVPTFVVPGLADYTVVGFLGYGRSKAGYIGDEIGVSLYPLLPADGSLYRNDVTITRTGRTQKMATTQEQFAMNGDAIQEITTLSLQNRDPAREAEVAAYQQDPNYVRKKDIPDSLTHKENGQRQPKQMTTPWEYTGNKWGMVIDLTSCIGCNACVTACQSENNIPVVGKTQVMRSRSMHWIRVDRYFTGDVTSPQSISQPVPCMHCENAPCEPVCPVAATTHDKEGLNVMTYNRCVGTRYCGNNCPYKVRRFNYLDFTNSGNISIEPIAKERNVLLQMQKNPDVTIRYRGVMEKCTYCTQRIQEAKMAARRNKQDPDRLADGSVTPACAQTCPTQAISFGNLNDETSRVSMLKKGNRNYDLLSELNTRPRTSYLSKLRNPNPELV